MARTATETKSKQSLDVIDMLMADHARVEKLFLRYEKLSPEEGPRHRDLLREIARELSVHATLEEQFLYPLVRESIPHGEALVSEAIDEHTQVEELLASMETTSPEEGLDADVNGVIEDVRHHVREEEEEMFPKLRAAVEERRLLEIGRAMRAARRVAPTRPHPNAPSTPPGNIVAGIPLAIVDRARDLVSGVIRAGFAIGKTVVRTGIDVARENMRRR